MSKELPHGWIEIPTGEVATLLRGISYKKEESSESQKTGFLPVLRANNLNDEIVLDDLVYVSKDLIKIEQLIKKNDILFAMSSGSKKHVGKCAIARKNIDASFGAFCGLLRVHESFNAQFLAYYFRSNIFRHHIQEISKGTNINNLKREHILDFALWFPPLDEQKRIVAKIEELFSELDKGIESLKTAREQLVLYKATLLDHYLHQHGRYQIDQLPLKDLIGPIQQGWSPKCDLNQTPEEKEWAIIKTTAVQPMQYIAEECKPLPNELTPRPGIEIKEGDLLMTRKGPRFRTGVVCLVRGVREKSMLCDTVYRFRANENQVSPQYLEIALNSPRVVAEINMRKSGINESGISLNHGKIKTVLIPVIKPREHQENIVSLVREKFSVIEKFDQEIEGQLSRAEILKQSILKRAFSGKLVAQDPKDEPASVLLERIRASKDSNQKKRKNAA